MLDVSDFLKENWFMLLVGVSGAVVLYQMLYKHLLVFKMTIDAMLLRVPLVKDVVKLFYMARFTALL